MPFLRFRLDDLASDARRPFVYERFIDFAWCSQDKFLPELEAVLGA